ncbi:MAG TPA: hypothetical protein VM370_00090 [Candidatus Thermoplasmatota archaeon]|nr:hypothetical protein [Candidatus Thermoplasmatota archaeon]
MPNAPPAPSGGKPAAKPSNVNPTDVHEPSNTRPPSQPTPSKVPDPQSAGEGEEDKDAQGA